MMQARLLSHTVTEYVTLYKFLIVSLFVIELKYNDSFNWMHPFLMLHRLADLSSQYELEHVPERVELLGVLDNFDEVLALINTPGRRYRTLNGKHIAATKIQSMWKRYVNRCAYLKYRQQRWNIMRLFFTIWSTLFLFFEGLVLEEMYMGVMYPWFIIHQHSHSSKNTSESELP